MFKKIMAMILTAGIILSPISLISAMADMSVNGSSYASAIQLSDNVSTQGSNVPDGNGLWFTYTVAQQGYFNFDYSASKFYMDLVIYDENMEIMYSNYDTGSDSTPTFTNKPGTKLYIKVCPSDEGGAVDGTSDDYQVKCNFTPASDWEMESNDTVDTANSLVNEIPEYGIVQNKNSRRKSDTDVFSYTAPSDGTVKFKFENVLSNSYFSWSMKVQNGSGSKIYSDDTSSNNIICTSDEINISAGETVYVFVSGEAGDGNKELEYRLTPLFEEKKADNDKNTEGNKTIGGNRTDNNTMQSGDSYSSAIVLKDNVIAEGTNNPDSDGLWFTYRVEDQGYLYLLL